MWSRRRLRLSAEGHAALVGAVARRLEALAGRPGPRCRSPCTGNVARSTWSPGMRRPDAARHRGQDGAHVDRGDARRHDVKVRLAPGRRGAARLEAGRGVARLLVLPDASTPTRSCRAVMPSCWAVYPLRGRLAWQGAVVLAGALVPARSSCTPRSSGAGARNASSRSSSCTTARGRPPAARTPGRAQHRAAPLDAGGRQTSRTVRARRGNDSTSRRGGGRGRRCGRRPGAPRSRGRTLGGRRRAGARRAAADRDGRTGGRDTSAGCATLGATFRRVPREPHPSEEQTQWPR